MVHSHLTKSSGLVVTISFTTIIMGSLAAWSRYHEIFTTHNDRMSSVGKTPISERKAAIVNPHSGVGPIHKIEHRIHLAHEPSLRRLFQSTTAVIPQTSHIHITPLATALDATTNLRSLQIPISTFLFGFGLCILLLLGTLRCAHKSHSGSPSGINNQAGSKKYRTKGKQLMDIKLVTATADHSPAGSQLRLPCVKKTEKTRMSAANSSPSDGCSTHEALRFIEDHWNALSPDASDGE